MSKSEISLRLINLKFVSGNEIPVRRASIASEEWDYVKDQLEIRLHLSLITAVIGFFLGVFLMLLVSFF